MTVLGIITVLQMIVLVKWWGKKQPQAVEESVTNLLTLDFVPLSASRVGSLRSERVLRKCF